MTTADLIALAILATSCAACAWIGISFLLLAYQLNRDRRTGYCLPPQAMEDPK